MSLREARSNGHKLLSLPEASPDGKHARAQVLTVVIVPLTVAVLTYLGTMATVHMTGRKVTIDEYESLITTLRKEVMDLRAEVVILREDRRKWEQDRETWAQEHFELRQEIRTLKTSNELLQQRLALLERRSTGDGP